MNMPIEKLYDWKTNEIFESSLNYAGFWMRLVALTIDLVIGFVVAFIILFFVDVDLWGDRAIGILMFSIVLSLRGYFQFKSGQSIGQKIMKVKIVSEHKKTIGRVIARNALTLLLAIIPVGNALNALVLAFSKEKQSLHDRGVDTWVVREL